MKHVTCVEEEDSSDEGNPEESNPEVGTPEVGNPEVEDCTVEEDKMKGLARSASFEASPSLGLAAFSSTGRAQRYDLGPLSSQG